MFKTRHLFQSNTWYNNQIYPLLRTIIPDLSVWLTGLKMLLMEWQGIGFEGLGIFICICICICMEWQVIGFEGLVIFICICIWYWIWGVGCLYLFVGDPFPSIFKHCLIFKTCFQFEVTSLTSFISQGRWWGRGHCLPGCRAFSI